MGVVFHGLCITILTKLQHKRKIQFTDSKTEKTMVAQTIELAPYDVDPDVSPEELAGLRAVPEGRVGRIPSGQEHKHSVHGNNEESVLCFNAVVDRLHAPANVDGDNATVSDGAGRVEVHTPDKLYLLTHGHDEQGHPKWAVLFRDGAHQQALVSIDTGDEFGLVAEQHRFRETHGRLVESPHEPIETEQYSVFDRVVEVVMSGEARIVVDP